MKNIEKIKFYVACILVGVSLLGMFFFIVYYFRIGNWRWGYNFIAEGSNVPIFFGLMAIAGVYQLSKVKGEDN